MFLRILLPASKVVNPCYWINYLKKMLKIMSRRKRHFLLSPMELCYCVFWIIKSTFSWHQTSYEVSTWNPRSDKNCLQKPVNPRIGWWVFFICSCKENSIAIPNLNRVFEPHNNQKHHQEIKYLHILFEKKNQKKKNSNTTVRGLNLNLNSAVFHF